MENDLSAGLRILEGDPEAARSAAHADFDPEQLRGRFVEVANAFGDELRNLLLNDFGREWMRSDPEGALRRAQSDRFRALKYHQSPVVDLVSKWVKIDLDSALQFIADTNDPAMKRYLTGNVIHDVGSDQPEKMLKWITENSKGSRQAGDFGSVLGKLAIKDPKRATAILAELPPGPLREASLRSVTGSWGQNDPQATLDWLLNLPADDSVNAAFTTFASYKEGTKSAILSFAESAPPNEIPPAFHAVVAQEKIVENADAAVAYVAGLSAEAQKPPLQRSSSPSCAPIPE
jgi:hypothetical protein